jgi:hypothetical protein
VLGIHIAWSLAVPIGLVESLFPRRRSEPWLGRIGLGIAGVLYLAGFAMVTLFSLGQTGFRASALQLGVSALLAGAAVAAAFLLFPRKEATATAPSRPPLTPAALAGFGLVAGSAFLLAHGLGGGVWQWPWPATLAASLATAATIPAFFAWAGRGRAWTARQTWAAAFGGMLCYAWFGYRVDRDLHGPAGVGQHSLFVALVLAVAIWAGVRAFREPAESPTG